MALRRRRLKVDWLSVVRAKSVGGVGVRENVGLLRVTPEPRLSDSSRKSEGGCAGSGSNLRPWRIRTDDKPLHTTSKQVAGLNHVILQQMENAHIHTFDLSILCQDVRFSESACENHLMVEIPQGDLYHRDVLLVGNDQAVIAGVVFDSGTRRTDAIGSPIFNRSS